MRSYLEPLLEFHLKLPALSKNETVVLKLLVEAAKLIVPIYKLQENKKFMGANFYPHDATKEEIKKAAEKNPEILSSYTKVERLNGGLTTVPYHKKYAKYLKPIAEKLEEAANVTENKEFGKLLKIQARALVKGTYGQAIIARLKMKPYILDISIGPLDFFDDQLFFIKGSYQAWVGVMDMEGTKKLTKYKDLILSAQRAGLIPSERVDNNKNVKAKVLDVVLFSGLMARTKFVGVNIPFDLNIVEKYGSEIVLFKQSNDLRIAEQILPTFNKIFSKAFREGFSEEDLRGGYSNSVALHELAHSYLHYRNASKNLQDLFPCIDELTATVLGFRMAGSLLLKDIVTSRQVESMIVAYLCRSMYLVRSSKDGKSMFSYARGGAIFLNFMVESGAIKQFKGLTIANFAKIFVAIHNLSLMLEQLLARGTRKDADAFIERYGQFPQLP